MNPLTFLRMLLAQQLGFQQMGRRPEPDGVTAGLENVSAYNRVMSTKLVLAYAVGLEVLHRCRDTHARGPAIDLACGPGHYTLCLARHLDYGSVTGVDLSSNMVNFAVQNAKKLGLASRVEFQIGDITNLSEVKDQSHDLTSFTDAAHHMPDMDTVTSIVHEMDRITTHNGVAMLLDLARMRTVQLTERYVKTVGHDYVRQGLSSFYEDFRKSMYAAWTVDELRQAIPRDSGRYWYHIVPRGLPTIQIIVGLPVGRKRLFVRSGFPWTNEDNPVPEPVRAQWRQARLTVVYASKSVISPKKKV